MRLRLASASNYSLMHLQVVPSVDRGVIVPVDVAVGTRGRIALFVGNVAPIVVQFAVEDRRSVSAVMLRDSVNNVFEGRWNNAPVRLKLLGDTFDTLQLQEERWGAKCSIAANSLHGLQNESRTCWRNRHTHRCRSGVSAVT